MSYQQVGTPRFFCDSFLSHSAAGLGSGENNLFNLNPTSQYLSVGTGSIDHPHEFLYYFTKPMYNIHYIAVLGHNLQGKGFWMEMREGDGSATFDFQGTPNSQVNWDGGTGIGYNGFSIRTFTDAGGYTGAADTVRFFSESVNVDIKIGCISMGSIYDMPHSPDLNLTMSREYGGTKTIETKGGASLSNTMWSKAPAWGNLGAWELEDSPAVPQPETPYQGSVELSRSGRRTWDLSFSYLQDSDVFGPNQTMGNTDPNRTYWYPGALTGGTTTGYEDADIASSGFTYNLLTDDNFYSQEIHKTNGGQLPFIFQPDGSNNNPDQFAICKLDMNSFKFEQVANGVYNINLKIREGW